MASSPDDAASELNVLVVASAGDPHAEAVIDHLRSRGKTVARLNAPDFISAKIRLSPGHAAVELDGTTWRIGSTTAVWWRRTGQADRPELKDEERRLLHEETRALLTDFLQAAGVRWHDAPGDVDVADRKLTQLASARRQGIRTPDTLVTTDESAAAAFMAGGPTVIKAMSAGEGIAPFVEELVAGDESRVSICPSLLQRRVDAVADLRVVTVGGEAWVWRRARSAGELDWREADHTGAGFVRHPAAGVQAAAVELSGRLGLTITIQDWLETADEPVFLESNAVGGWYFLDGAPDILAPAIAELLIEGPLISDGFWPKLRQRWFYDFLSKDKAPFQDGAKAPLIPRPAWLAQVANRPVAIELERSARIDAESSVQATEAKGDRLLQLSLAVLTLAFLVSGFQLSWAADRSRWWLLALLPTVAAIGLLILAATSAAQIDRVAFYKVPGADVLIGSATADDAIAILWAEHRGHQLASWSTTRKIDDLMQARAWFTRGAGALLVVALLALVGRIWLS